MNYILLHITYNNRFEVYLSYYMINTYKMQSMEKFCLKWSDFESNTRSCFREERQASDFYDVTLLCEEEQIRAHRLVLSAGSSFFKEAFRMVNHPHPVIYLKGVKRKDIESVLDFLYYGEAKVPLEDLSTFFETTKDLKIKGIHEKVVGPINKESVTIIEDVVKIDNVTSGPDIDLFGEKLPNEGKEIFDPFYNIHLDNVISTPDERLSNENEEIVNISHRKDHEDISGLTCSFGCGKTFTFANYLSIHERKVHNRPKFKRGRKPRFQEEVRGSFIYQTDTADVGNADKHESNTMIETQVDSKESVEEYAPRSFKPSPVWQYWTKLSADSAVCNICTKHLSGESRKNMRIHLEKVHFIKLEKREMKKLSFDISSAPTYISEKQSSPVWKHCTRLSKDLAKCNQCDKIIPCTGGSTGGLARHVLRSHNIDVKYDAEEVEKHLWDQFTKSRQEDKSVGLLSLEDFSGQPFAETGDGRRQSLVWKYFERVGEVEAKCFLCGKIVDCLDSRSPMRRHLITHTHQQPNKLKEIALCNKCEWCVDLKAGSRVKMMEHLETVHESVC